MGCCQSQGQFSEKNELNCNQDQKTKEEVQQNIKEIQNADKTQKDQSVSKQVVEQSISKTNNQSNLPNSQNAGVVINNPSNNNETQPDAKQEEQINTEISQDMHNEENQQDEDTESDEDEQVVNIIDQIINQRRENMES